MIHDRKFHCCTKSIVNSNLYSYTICRRDLSMIALGFNGRRDGTIIQPKRSGELSRDMEMKSRR